MVGRRKRSIKKSIDNIKQVNNNFQLFEKTNKVESLKGINDLILI